MGKIVFLLKMSWLWLVFWAGFILWWRLMSLLFERGEYTLAILVAYSLPVSYTLAAFIASRMKGSYIKLLHFFTLFILSLIFAVILAFENASFPWEPGAYTGIALISLVMAIMQYPKAGLRHYETYKTSLFIGGVIFMPLFIYFAAMLPNVPQTPALDKVWLFPVGMLGFWLSGAWLASRDTQGVYVPGLEIKPLMPFRPDFILPGGVLFVKGLVMMGVGLMLAIHPMLGMPMWNWWGFVLAFWGIVTLIPLRGMYKMVKGKRARMLGMGGTGFTHEFYKGLILFVGLNIVIYGFVNAFLGTTPFLAFGVKRESNSFLLMNVASRIAYATFILSFAVLVLLRVWYKLKLLEGAETRWQMLNKQLLLYVGVLLLFVSYIHFLNLPPIRGLGYMSFYPGANPVGFWLGIGLFLAGSVLILVLRPIALKNEFEAMVATMVGVIGDTPERLRRWVMENRIKALSAMPAPQRDRQMKLMMAGLNSLPPEKKELMMKTQIDILSTLDSAMRRRMMASMDRSA